MEHFKKGDHVVVIEDGTFYGLGSYGVITQDKTHSSKLVYVEFLGGNFAQNTNDNTWVVNIREIVPMYQIGDRVEIISVDEPMLEYYSIGAQGHIIADVRLDNGSLSCIVEFDSGEFMAVDDCSHWHVNIGNMIPVRKDVKMTRDDILLSRFAKYL